VPKKSKYVFDVSNRRNLNLDRETMHGGWPSGEYDPPVPDVIHNWFRSMNLSERKQHIRSTLKKMLAENRFLSHSYEPSIGNTVINTNPKCKHRGSVGIVIRIESLDSDAGKIVCYECTNDGPYWKAGQILKKTMDQLEPFEDYV